MGDSAEPLRGKTLLTATTGYLAIENQPL